MSNYNRLTKRTDELHIAYSTEPLLDIVSRLAEFEDKIEQDLMIELPCKVGDIVYAPHWHFGEWDRIVPYQITNITITQNKKLEWTKKYRAMEIVDGKTTDWQINFSFDEIGQKVFLDKVKAEQKLKELKGEV